jgi:transposase
MKTNISNQLHADSIGINADKLVIRQLNKLIAVIDKQLEEMEKNIVNHIASDDVVQQKVKGILKIKGVGILTVATLVAETNGFLLFKNKAQLVSYAGYDVIENQSGNHIGKTRISKKGNSHIRRILHMPAFNVVRCQVPPFAQLFNRTIQTHHVKMKSYVAVQKKLLVVIYALWKNNQSFDENYTSKNITVDAEPAHSSRFSFEEAVPAENENSLSISQGYTRCTTVDESPSAPSRLLQK